MYNEYGYAYFNHYKGDRAVKELKKLQANLRRNPHRVYFVGNLEIRMEVKEA